MKKTASKRKRKWSNSIDPSTIPHSVIMSERARRNRARRTTPPEGAGGRPKIMRTCEKCACEMTTRELHIHKCGKEES